MADEQISCCGIDCSTCDIYVAAHDPAAARQLAARWRANGVTEAQPDWFQCEGCRGDRSVCWSGDCKLYACCTERGKSFCDECDGFPCATYIEWADAYPHHRAAYERLQARRQQA